MTETPPRKYFNSAQLETVNQAVTISEDLISDRFQLTISTWKKYRYDIRTLKDLTPEEIVPDVFAQIVRCTRPAPRDGFRGSDSYRICLQDHNILEALDREPDLKLLPLLIYVVAHELVHIIRFYRFDQSFEAYEAQRAAEEARVHQLTYQMLRAVNLEDLPMILEFYARDRKRVD